MINLHKITQEAIEPVRQQDEIIDFVQATKQSCLARFYNIPAEVDKQFRAFPSWFEDWATDSEKAKLSQLLDEFGVNNDQ